MKRLLPALLALALAPIVVCAQDNPFKKGGSRGNAAPAQTEQSEAAPAQQAAPAQKKNTGKIGFGGNAADPKKSQVDVEVDEIFDLENDMINPTDGTVMWKNKVFRPEDNVVFRERFERYLASPAPQPGDDAKYKKKYNEICALIDGKKVKRMDFRKNLWKALHALYDLAEFDEIDDGQSLVVAEVVFKALRVRADVNEMRMNAAILDEKKRKLRFNLEVKDNNRRYKEQEMQRKAQAKSGGNGKGKVQATTPTTTLAPDQKQLQIAEDLKATETSIIASNTDRIAMESKAKLEFQSAIAQFTFDRRYEHAILAQKFYRMIFNAENQDQIVGNREIKEYVPISDFTASVESLEGLLRDARVEASKFVRSSHQLYKNGKKYRAFRQLLSAFTVGEHQTPVIFYPEDRKNEFLDLWLLTHDLAKESETRELDAIEGTLDEIKKIAPDFPEAEVRGKLRAAKQASKMAVLRAKQTFLMAAAAGTPEAMDDAMDSIQESIELASKYWPQNPEIEQMLAEVLQQSNVLSRLAPEFDRLVDGNKKREIFNRRVEFTAALMGDADRRTKLEKIVAEVATLEAVLNQVRAQIDARNEYIAWDMLAKAEEIDANDTEVIMSKARLVPLVADYSQLLARAAQEEKRGVPALALNFYLAAQKLNPASEVCAQSISRTAQQLLDQQTGVPTKNLNPEPANPVPANPVPAAGTPADDEFNF